MPGPKTLSDYASAREQRVWIWVTNAWLLLCVSAGCVAGVVFAERHAWHWWGWVIGAYGAALGLAAGLLLLVVPIHIRKRQLQRAAS